MCIGDRLSKDLKEIEGTTDVNIELTDDPAAVILNFNVDEHQNIPSQFLVKVPRYYPHSCPIVTCLQEKFCNSYFISSSNIVCHQDLQHNWSAIDTIQTVIAVLQMVRYYNPNNIENVIHEHETDDSIRDNDRMNIIKTSVSNNFNIDSLQIED